jgi:hypothetical protein
LAQHNLKNVSRADVLHALADRFFVFMLLEVRLPGNLRCTRRGNIRRRQIRRLRQAPGQFIDPATSIVVSCLRVAACLVEPGHGNDK